MKHYTVVLFFLWLVGCGSEDPAGEVSSSPSNEAEQRAVQQAWTTYVSIIDEVSPAVEAHRARYSLLRATGGVQNTPTRQALSHRLAASQELTESLSQARSKASAVAAGTSIPDSLYREAIAAADRVERARRASERLQFTCDRAFWQEDLASFHMLRRDAAILAALGDSSAQADLDRYTQLISEREAQEPTEASPLFVELRENHANVRNATRSLDPSLVTPMDESEWTPPEEEGGGPGR